jgi:hypothetical protein
MALFSLFKQNTRAEEPEQTAVPPAAEPRFLAVQVVPDPAGCCSAVKVIAGERLLVDRAPPLPLADCDRGSCHCRYEQYDDRRGDLRRDSDVGIRSMADLYNDSGRSETAPGRRADDLEKD